jgi:hypothetical protein
LTDPRLAKAEQWLSRAAECVAKAHALRVAVRADKERVYLEARAVLDARIREECHATAVESVILERLDAERNAHRPTEVIHTVARRART